MASILTPQGVALVTAMAVSGTVILLAFRLQKSFPPTQFLINIIPHSSQPIPRPCISSDGTKRSGRKKKKRVHFAEDVVEPSGKGEEFRRQRRGHGNSSGSTPPSRAEEREDAGGMPANRLALYNGILRERLVHRLAYSY